jgi:Predicted membrane protein
MKNYQILRIAVAMFVAIVVGLSVTIGTILPAILAIIIGAMVSYIYKKSADEILEDERITKVSEKASRSAIVVFSISIALIGMFLIILRNEYPDFTQAGFTLSYASVALLTLYYIFYGYYNKKYGS